MFRSTIIIILFSLSSLSSAEPVVRDKAELAVANILFDYSNGETEYASYRVDDDGYAHVSFASNIPDELYGQIITTMQEHPDISDVIFDKGGPVCKLR